MGYGARLPHYKCRTLLRELYIGLLFFLIGIQISSFESGISPLYFDSIKAICKYKYTKLEKIKKHLYLSSCCYKIKTQAMEMVVSCCFIPVNSMLACHKSF